MGPRVGLDSLEQRKYFFVPAYNRSTVTRSFSQLPSLYTEAINEMKLHVKFQLHSTVTTKKKCFSMGHDHVVCHKFTDVSEQPIAVLLLLIKMEVVSCYVTLTSHIVVSLSSDLS